MSPGCDTCLPQETRWEIGTFPHTDDLTRGRPVIHRLAPAPVSSAIAMIHAGNFIALLNV